MGDLSVVRASGEIELDRPAAAYLAARQQQHGVLGLDHAEGVQVSEQLSYKYCSTTSEKTSNDCAPIRRRRKWPSRSRIRVVGRPS